MNFKVTSGRVAVTDPCHSQAAGIPALNGSWMAKAYTMDAGDWGRRVSKIIVHHETFSPIGGDYVEETRYVGVDSGQAGVFDLDPYAGSHEEIYDACSRASNPYGFVSCGFVSSTGFGDGCYHVTLYRQRNLVHAVEIVFVPEHATV